VGSEKLEVIEKLKLLFLIKSILAEI